jgi:protein-S-isoprenylcysteine O-methyltransferase Ste14
MQTYVFAIIAVAWVLWFIPFFRKRTGSSPAQTTDSRARWGVGLQIVGYSLLWQAKFWLAPVQLWQLATGIVFFALAILLSWSGRRALGRHWRIDAGLYADHQLVTSGPYRFARHPIYASMLCIFLATGVLVAPWWLFVPATLVFIAGTEIRVRIEDRLLSSRFREESSAYRSRVKAYIPYIR